MKGQGLGGIGLAASEAATLRQTQAPRVPNLAQRNRALFFLFDGPLSS